MRILIVTHYQPPHRGGIETVAAALAERYQRAGHDVVWLASDVPRIAAVSGHVRVPAWNVLEDLLGVPFPLWHPRASTTVRRWVEWCDVVHCHDCLYLGTGLAVRHARRLGKPVLLTQHVGIVPYRSWWLRMIQRVAYSVIGRRVHRRADQVIFISHAVMDWFQAQVSYRRPPRFLANGVDTALFHFADEAARRDARLRLHLPLERRIVLFVGRFVDKKGIPIVEQIAHRYRDWVFVLVGDGPIDPQTRSQGNVTIVPFQPHSKLPDYYWASDLLLLPSTGEGFPLVVMEAMACGTPTLVSSETFAAWNHGREHFLLSEPTAAAVAAVLDEQSTLMAPSCRGTVAAYAKAQWDWDRVAQEYLRLLAELLVKPSRVEDTRRASSARSA